jgi:pilus assembly protein CpaE
MTGGLVLQTILLSGLPPDAQAALQPTLEELALRTVKDTAQRPSLAVVSVDGDVPASIRLTQALSAAGTRVAVVGRSKDPDLILLAMRAGAREFLVSTDRAELDAAVRTLARPTTAPTPGMVTALFAAKGGMGATSIAANLAGFIAARGERVCLTDLDLELGDVLAQLDLAPGYSITDVIDNMRRLDRDLLDASVVRHRSGVAVLTRGERLEDAGRLDAENVGTLLSFLRTQYAHVLVDGLRGFGDLSLAALDVSDRVLLLVTQEVAAVRNAQRCVEIFRRLNYPESKVQLVVNRYQKGSRITKEVVTETTGVPVAATIANDFAILTRAVNRGNLLPEEAPRSAIARDVEALLGLLGGSVETPARRSSMFGRWFAAKAAAHGAH